MSKRHQSSRRKSYGRRQHEIRERVDRQHTAVSADGDFEEWGSATPADPLAFLDPRSPRLNYAHGE
jgi:hypothetical protein